MRIFEKEWVRSAMLALIIIGVVLAVLGVQQFVDAMLRIQDNPAYQASVGGETVALETQTQAQGLIAAGMAYRELVAQRNMALIYGGAGLALTALGWLGYDLIRARQRRRTAATS